MGVDDTPENRAKFEASFPLGKALQTNSSLGYVANAAVYLCSDEAAFISGVNLPIDGAATVHAPGGDYPISVFSIYANLNLSREVGIILVYKLLSSTIRSVPCLSIT